MASRNRTEMSAAIFGKLIAHADQGGIIIDALGEGRWIKRLSSADAELMAKAEVDSLILGRNTKALMVTHDEATYYLLSGFRQPNATIEGLVEHDLTPGLFAIAITELNIDPSTTPARIRNTLEGRYFGVKGYNGHDLAEISGLYPQLICLKAATEYPFTENLIRAIGSYVAKTYESGPLAISQDTKDALSNLFETGNKYIPYPLILQGMLSFSWQYFYLEVYRCIENMYPFSRLSRLSAKWTPSSSLRDVAILLENELSWRPREEEALIATLTHCSDSNISELYSSLGGASDTTNDLRSSAAKRVYNTRNELVHFRPRIHTGHQADEAWDSQVRSLINCIIDIYGKLGDMFHEFQESTN